MGADVRIEPEAGSETWEPVGDVTIRGGPLRGTTIGGAEIPNLIDELPILAVAGALAQGETVIRDAAELRVKESDRIATTAAGLREMGVEVEERPDGITVRGGCPLRASDGLKSHGDHRIAMALAVLSLFAPGASVVHDIACVDTSYPGFWADLKKLVK
jgi:3-phosphoshikimate 1-carboxyvinyltransferase